MAQIIDIATAVPDYLVENREFMDFYSNALTAAGMNPISKKLRLFIEKTKIINRYSCIPDFNGIKHELFLDGDYNPSVEKRMAVYKKKLLPLATVAVDKLFRRNNIEPSDITHLITVSCTGLFAPGLEYLMADHYAMTHVEKLGLNFLGCYAAIKAIKHANYIAQAVPSACILIVCAELCSLHFNLSEADEDIVPNLLFADGAAAVILCGDEFSYDKSKTVLAIDAVDSAYIPDTSDLMTWNISSGAFNMYLNKNIVGAIKESIATSVNNFLTRADSNPDYWAIHPGGTGIVEAVRQSLELTSSDVEDSLEVLTNYGNMSSPTILFILARLLNKIRNDEHSENKKIFACAFGPGLTVEMIGLSASESLIKKAIFKRAIELFNGG
jgi:alpha-pyrone synthase